MSKFRKFAIFFVILEIIIILSANWYAVKTLEASGTKQYKVDISRALTAMRNGNSVDVTDYSSIIKISKFDDSEICNNSYEVHSVDNVFYRFEYRIVKSNAAIWIINITAGIMLAMSILLLIFIDKKVARPFNSMGGLAVELSKGNLSTPIKQEKSKVFGKFLWGMDLLREKLEQDKEKELELQKERKTLILSLSHDIKTPLSAIELYSKALQDNLYDSEEKKHQAILGIKSNTEEIKRYVSEITKASREDFLNLEVKNSEFYLDSLLDNIKKFYSEKLSILHTEFCIEPSENCLLLGDLDRCVEILQNIIENAIKYGDGRYIHILVDEEEDCKLIKVSNSGCTLKSEEIPNIFDSFYRGSNTDGIKGSGLGLYICKNLLKKMEGDIFAECENNEFNIIVVLRKV